MSTAVAALNLPFRTNVDLIDLGTKDPRLAGILSPDYDEKVVRNYIHQQFLDDAGEYMNKYTSHDHWRRILTTAQSHLRLPLHEQLNILDLGSGGGNTIFPLLDLYPYATVIASDLSVPLLRALKRKQLQDYPERQCLVMQLNAEELVFADGQFDLVVGAAILHHLFDPQKSLREAARVLKPGGCALFFEPFETGQQIVALAMVNLMGISDFHRSRGSHETLPDAAVEAFKRICIDFAVRKGSDKSGEIYRNIDDKWLFTRSYLQAAATRCGFREVELYPLYGVERLFSSQVATYLRLSAGLELSALPGWAQQYLQGLDQHFSPDARQDLLLEAGVVLRK